jgi:uncharacterized repeat protein (TIGR01451 family)/fimbrial isopeptide formation D2 family protein
MPAVNVAVPALPRAMDLTSTALAASDPTHVSFTLEGCRLPDGTTLPASLVCSDAYYTTGNLGKSWNELDLVPHRLTTSVGTQSDATTDYTVGIAADHMDGGHPGYDVMTAPVVNAAKSDASCSVSAGDETVIDPGVGGTDQSLGRLFTIHQNKGTTCVFDWVERLALGSHLFPGSSLHTNRTNQAWSTQGIGAADVSIPVKEILPQELSKDMTAEQGQAYGWSISKSANPTSLSFDNSCLTSAGARSAQVQITVTWTRTGPTGSGATTLTTHVYATNPAHRTITVDVTDRIYEGATQGTLLDTASSGSIDVPAFSDEMLVLTHTTVYNGSATTFNDVASATYTDKITGIAVPGQTSASASATTVAAAGDPANSTVTISDTESISGDHLSFSVAAPSVGSFSGYTAGTQTTGPVDWSYGPVGSSGSVTFTKTVSLDEPAITSGSLSDTATITGDGDTVLDSDSLSVPITSSASVSLTINKTIPAGALRSGESVTFDFDVTGPHGYSDTASITFTYGGSTSGSATLTGLEPGTYTVSEQPEANWAAQPDQQTDIELPDCSGSVNFTNSELAPDLSLSKAADDAVVNAGDQIGFVVDVANSGDAGTGTAKDVALNDPLPQGDGIDWSIDDVSGSGGFTPALGDCAITGSPSTGETLACSFGDLLPGQGVSVHVVSDTDGSSCGDYLNVATLSASNHGSLEAQDSVTVECPDIVVSKTGSGTVSANDAIYFEITVSNNGDGDAHDFAFSDTLPDVAGGWTLVQPAEDGCQLNGLALTCAKDVFDAGDSFTLRVEADTQFGDCGELYNLASASASNEADEDLANNSDDHTIVVECPDLTATKVADDDVVSAGQQIGFTMTVSNADAAGTGTAYDVELNDPLPAGSGLDWSIDPANGDCQITGSVGSQVLECSFGDLGPGDSASVHVVSDTSKADCATYPNEASITAANHPELNPSDDATVECPGLNISKTANNGTIDAGELASYTITVWNAGPGAALDASWSDELPAGVSWTVQLQNPDGDDVCMSSMDAEGNQSASCSFGDLAASDKAGGKVIVVSGWTDRADCGVLDNTAFADASNADTVQASASITVTCPTVAIQKVNDQPDPVLPGTVVSYTVTVTVSDGPAKDVTVSDVLPLGLDAPTSISDGGTYAGGTRTITWNLGDLADGSYELTYQAAVSASAAHGDELVNVATVTSSNSQCPDDETLADECVDDSTVTVRVPTLVIDKAADTEIVHFVFDEEGNVLSVDPAQVTWTLSYTLTNGPVTNAVITDPLPDFLTFVSASDGGAYDDATRTITWTLGTLSASGSVTFVTTVDPDAPEPGPIVNVATIVSDQTPADDGTDSITVTSESEQAGTSTPSPSVPDTALVAGPNGQPLTIPIELMVVFFLGSLGALAFANVRAVRRRR